MFYYKRIINNKFSQNCSQKKYTLEVFTINIDIETRYPLNNKVWELTHPNP